MPHLFPPVDRRSIVGLRPARNPVDSERPYAFLVEEEAAVGGGVDQVATVFLTHPECAFRCLMCDLWRNTLDHLPPPESTVRQLQYALQRLPDADRIKLYNSGNFFDQRAVPREQYAAIAALCQPFHTVTVENHPRFCGPDVLAFSARLHGQLEVALGLETVHPEILRRLNKQMTVDDFRRAAEFLRVNEIGLRVFLLLRPPGMTESEGREWAMRSADIAFQAGAGLCALIPTRGGNGVMEQLASQGWFAPPTLESLEVVMDEMLSWQRGRVVADLWDIERLVTCAACGPERIRRLQRMNLEQRLLPSIACQCQENRSAARRH